VKRPQRATPPGKAKRSKEVSAASRKISGTLVGQPRGASPRLTLTRQGVLFILSGKMHFSDLDNNPKKQSTHIRLIIYQAEKISFSNVVYCFDLYQLQGTDRGCTDILTAVYA
jgi:hypothetical protein